MVVPGLPHHVTQRGNRREAVFFDDGDQQIYCDMLAEQFRKFTVEVWAYCLMPNHVHLILTPQGAEGMSRALGEAHRRYTNFINARSRWTGHLFQSRFASVAMDESHLKSAVSVRQSESGSGPACVSRRGMGMVECAGTSCGRG